MTALSYLSLLQIVADKGASCEEGDSLQSER
jgi:hypothetical protein